MDKIVKFNAQTAGRDKLCRLFQYGSKCVWWSLDQQGKQDWVKVIKQLEYSISTARKLMRFGKSLEIMYSTLKTIHIQDVIHRVTITMSRIAGALYLVFDHVIWLGRVKLIDGDTKKWSESSARFWLVQLIFQLARDFYDLSLLYDKHFKGKNSTNHENTKSINNKGISCFLDEGKPALLDALKNACDLVQPLSTLQYVKPRPFLQGLCGVSASLVGIIVILDPGLKLSP